MMPVLWLKLQRLLEVISNSSLSINISPEFVTSRYIAGICSLCDNSLVRDSAKNAKASRIIRCARGGEILMFVLGMTRHIQMGFTVAFHCVKGNGSPMI